jgi:tRNA (Thr-GGU) A37 N-methylase
VLDGTPLLDIKPYATQFDAQTDVRNGWLEQSGAAVSEKRSDDRFNSER